MPSLRHCSGGPPPSAIHGRGRLPRHPCRGAPCATPAFGLWERGGRSEAKAKQSKAKQRQDQKIAAFGSSLTVCAHLCSAPIPCRSELARDGLTGIAFVLIKTVIVNALREQARSHIWSGYTCERLVGCQAAFAGKPRSYRKSEAERRTLLLPTTHQVER